jgi:hypothetical protein
LPFGQGKTYLNNMSGAADAFLGGWSMNWIVSLYSGQPQNIRCISKTWALGPGGCNALLVPGQDPFGGKHNVEQFYNPDAFVDPPTATSIGQTDFAPLGGGRTPVTGPPFRRMDYSLFKQFRTTESTRLEFRAEVFNLTNTPNFALPLAANLNFTDKTNFGKITSTRNNPNDARQIQFALKFYW